MAPRRPVKKATLPKATAPPADAADEPFGDQLADPAAAAALHPDGIAGPGRADGIVPGEPVLDADDDNERVSVDEFGRSMAAGVSR